MKTVTFAAAIAAFAIALPATAQDVVVAAERQNPALIKLEKDRTKLASRVEDRRKRVAKQEDQLADARDDVEDAQKDLRKEQKDLDKAREKLADAQSEMRALETRYREVLLAGSR